MLEITSEGRVYRAYVYSPSGQKLALQSWDDKFYWVHTDHLGTAVRLTDSTGEEFYKAEFDPHGQPISEWANPDGETFLTSHKFTGYERDWATLLDYAKARTYQAERGRFLQPDPLGLGAADLTSPQSLNRYSYVRNDPINLVDPSGLLTCFGYHAYSQVTDPESGELIGETYVGFIPVFCWDENPVTSSGGGGSGSGQNNQPDASSLKEPIAPSASQCSALRELLKREKEFGTQEASLRSASFFKGRHKANDYIVDLMNSVNNYYYNGQPLDLDWWMTINGLSWHRPSQSFVVYGVGKTFWFLSKKLANLVLDAIGESGFPGRPTAPFKDPGEKLALFFASQRYRYADIFNESWMKADCERK